MKVIITERIDNVDGFDEVTYYSVNTPQNRMDLSNMCECPEEATLSRELGCIFNLPSIIKEAYEAGKNGEKLTFETKIRKFNV